MKSLIPMITMQFVILMVAMYMFSSRILLNQKLIQHEQQEQMISLAVVQNMLQALHPDLPVSSVLSDYEGYMKTHPKK